MPRSDCLHRSIGDLFLATDNSTVMHFHPTKPLLSDHFFKCDPPSTTVAHTAWLDLIAVRPCALAVLRASGQAVARDGAWRAESCLGDHQRGGGVLPLPQGAARHPRQADRRRPAHHPRDLFLSGPTPASFGLCIFDRLCRCISHPECLSWFLQLEFPLQSVGPMVYAMKRLVFVDVDCIRVINLDGTSQPFRTSRDPNN